MPQVPYSPVPNVVPGATPDPQANISTPPAAFGITEAEAEKGLGQQVERSADQFGTTALRLQTMKNDTTAKQMFVDQSAIIGEKENDFYSKKGIDAVNARPQFEADMKNIYETSVANAPNNQVRQQLSDALSRRISYSIIDGQRHAGTQQLEYNKTVSNAAVADAMVSAAQHPYDDGMFDETLKTIDAESRKQAAAAGESEISAKLNSMKWTSMAWEQRLKAIGFNDPATARALFSQHKSEIQGVNSQGEPYSMVIERYLQQQDDKIGVRNAAHNILFGGDYYSRLNAQEGTSRSPTSSAVGYGQITKDTWDDIRKAHPELNLPASHAAASTEDNMRATKAFTEDNQAKLEKAGITPNMSNSYMAHFLGANGAIRFIQGMEANPSALATTLADPAAVKANRAVFYDGSRPRTAEEVYALQTAKFQGPGQLNADSGPDYLENALSSARDLARATRPNDPTFEDALLARVNQDYNYFHNAYRQQEYGTYTNLVSAITGANGGNRATNMDAIWNNPVLAQQYNDLGQTASGRMRQKQLQTLITNQNKQGSLAPDEQTALFNKIMGMSIAAEKDPEARDAFTQLDLGDLSGKLSQNLIDKVGAEQRSVLKHWQGKAEQLEKNNRLTGALSFLKPTLDSYNIHPSKTDTAANDQYLQFTGALYQRLSEVEAQTGKPVTDQVQIMSLAGPLLQQMGDSRTWLGGWSPFSNTAPRSYEVPKDFSDKVGAAFKAKYNRDPTPFEMGVIYQKSLAHPELKAAYGL